MPEKRAPFAESSEHLADIADKDVFRVDAHGLRHFTVLDEVAVLAVDGHEILRTGERQNDFQLFLTGVAGGVDVRQTVVNDVRALFKSSFIMR